MNKIAYLLGRGVGFALRLGRPRQKFEIGKNANGVFPEFAFSGCVTRERTSEPSTAAYSNEATIGDLIDILEHGVAKPRKRAGRRVRSS